MVSSATTSHSPSILLLIRMGIPLFAISFMICLSAAVLFLFNPAQSLALPPAGLQQLLPSYLQTENQGWREPGYQCQGHHCRKDGWNVLYHLGGNGPWIEKVDGVAKGGIAVPEGCQIDMVHMVYHPFLFFFKERRLTEQFL